MGREGGAGPEIKQISNQLSGLRSTTDGGEQEAGAVDSDLGVGGRQEVEKEVLETWGTSPPAPGGEAEARQGALYHWGGGS